MKKAKRRGDAIVDAFLAAVNLAPREELLREEKPKACLLSAGDWPTLSTGKLYAAKMHVGFGPWSVACPFLYQRPSARSFRDTHFRCLSPVPLTLHAVGLPEPDTNLQEFRSAILADANLSPFLLNQGFLPFARPASGSYDPVCFDCRNSRRKAEPAVVRVDHEEILCNDRLRVVEQLAAGFDVLLEETTRALEATTARSP